MSPSSLWQHSRNPGSSLRSLPPEGLQGHPRRWVNDIVWSCCICTVSHFGPGPHWRAPGLSVESSHLWSHIRHDSCWDPDPAAGKWLRCPWFEISRKEAILLKTSVFKSLCTLLLMGIKQLRKDSEGRVLCVEKHTFCLSWLGYSCRGDASWIRLDSTSSEASKSDFQPHFIYCNGTSGHLKHMRLQYFPGYLQKGYKGSFLFYSLCTA